MNERIRASVASIGLVVSLLACQAGATSSPGAASRSGGSPGVPLPTAGSIPVAGTPSGATGTPRPDGLVLVALGDSASTGHGDPSRRGWVRYYADLVAAALGRTVTVQNLATDGTSTEALLARVRSAPDVRAAVERADIVVIGIGGNDLNVGDAEMGAGRCAGTACYDAPAAGYRANLDGVATEISSLRSGQPTMLRAIGMPNTLTGAESVIPPFLVPRATEVGAYQARVFDRATCDVMAAHHGACASLGTAFNGPDGTADAYASGLLSLTECCYPTETGHRLIAKVLFDAGLSPLKDLP